MKMYSEHYIALFRSTVSCKYIYMRVYVENISR